MKRSPCKRPHMIFRSLGLRWDWFKDHDTRPRTVKKILPKPGNVSHVLNRSLGFLNAPPFLLISLVHSLWSCHNDVIILFIYLLTPPALSCFCPMSLNHIRPSECTNANASCICASSLDLQFNSHLSENVMRPSPLLIFFHCFYGHLSSPFSYLEVLQ